MENEEINVALKNHQIEATEWANQKLAQSLHLWAERFIIEFKLECPTPAIKIEWLRSNYYGHFRPGRNGFGITNEIAINKKHLDEREYWETVGTLLHELIHAEQQAIGTESERNYHNNAFFQRAQKFGLIVDRCGHQEYAPGPTPFFSLLDKYGVDSPKTHAAILAVNDSKITTPSKSKLKLWQCSCKPKPYKVRVARKDFQAQCLKCGQIFMEKN